MSPLTPREAVAAILATPLDSRAFFAGMTAAEFFAIHPQVIAPPEEGDPRVTVIEQTETDTGTPARRDGPAGDGRGEEGQGQESEGVMGGDCGMQIFWLAQKVKQAESIDGVPEYIAGAFKDAVELAKALNMERLRLAADREPLAWTKERPTKAGWYFTRQRDPGTGDPYDPDCEYFDEDDRLRLPSIYFDDREFAGPIPEPKEAS